MNKKLYRDEYHKVLGGVCAGLAEYFEMDVTIVRLLLVGSVCLAGVGVIPYIVLWIVLPRKGYLYSNFNNPTVDYTVPPQQPGGQFNNPQQGANPFGGNPFGGNPYGGNPFSENPIENVPKQKSHAGIIVGTVLILIGGFILIDEYDLIPDFDFGRLWPLILVIAGCALLLSGQQNDAWHKHNLKNADKNDNDTTADAAPQSDSTNNI
ncbi:PspC domain-containing protein [Mucilaginibacter sp. BJC16-A38]|uniref:PspC domain-containing protein n=1 Tax=Mucilaginibacter phenanthrenivorans TaxID=1234842 RepID=UPI00215838D2|nr:PspC domain-containing protein [Mucilaginibacter phenanthrenivorans]MCR8558745.1 PspC domain-containing protein [Mucilaginibacter phenanthrenivorans]